MGRQSMENTLPEDVGVMLACQRKEEHETIGGAERPYFESCEVRLCDMSEDWKVLESIDAKEVRFSAVEGVMPTEIEVKQAGSSEEESEWDQLFEQAKESSGKKSGTTREKPKGVRPEWELEKEPKTPTEKKIAHEEVGRIKKKGR